MAPSDTPVSECCNLPIHIDVEQDPAESYTPLPSRTAHLTVIDVLAVGVSKMKGPDVDSHLSHLNRGLVGAFGRLCIRTSARSRALRKLSAWWTTLTRPTSQLPDRSAEHVTRRRCHRRRYPAPVRPASQLWWQRRYLERLRCVAEQARSPGHAVIEIKNNLNPDRRSDELTVTEASHGKYYSGCASKALSAL